MNTRNTNDCFTDLFDVRQEPDAVAFARHLEAICTNETPPKTLNWTHFTSHVLPHQTPSAWWTRMFQRQRKMVAVSRPATLLRPARFSLVLAVVLCLLMATTVVYAASGGSILNGILQQFQQTHQYPQVQSYANQSQSHSIDGYTLTVSKVYADSARIIMGYNITSPKSVDDTTVMNKFATNFAKLTTQQGVFLPPLDGLEQINSGISGLVMNFDASALQGPPPTQLALQLKIPYGSQAQNEPYKIQGWLSYTLMVPFHPGRVAEVHQTQTSQGLVLKVNRVIVAPSATIICMQGLNEDNDWRYFSSTMDVGQIKNVLIHSRGLSSSCGQGTWQITIYDARLFSQQGIWTLTIATMHAKILHIPTSLTGAHWTFKFTVPMVAA